MRITELFDNGQFVVTAEVGPLTSLSRHRRTATMLSGENAVMT